MQKEVDEFKERQSKLENEMDLMRKELGQLNK
jgi:hypothetical protein